MIILPFHPAHEFPGGDIPIKLIGIGNKKSQDGSRRKSQRVAIERIAPQGQQSVRLKHQLLVEPGRQILLQANIIECYPHGRLVTSPQIIQDRQVAGTIMNRVTPRPQMSGITQHTRQPPETTHPPHASLTLQLLTNTIKRRRLIHVNISGPLRKKIGAPNPLINIIRQDEQ